MKPRHLTIQDNHLYLNNHSLYELAHEYQTPLYVYDEFELHERMDEYKQLFKSKKFTTEVVYASKAFLVPELCNIVNEHGLWMDAVSIGDLFIANYSKFPLNNIIFHGNNKTNDELIYAVENGVGIIVVDNYDELIRLDQIANERNTHVNTLFRVNPGIDVHTHKYIKTALYVSKFGESIYDEKTINTILEAYKNSLNVSLLGFHAHIGSQIKEVKPFISLIDKMIEFTKNIEDKYEIKLPYLNLGGGFGVKYYEEDNEISLAYVLEKMIKRLEKTSKQLEYNLEKVFIEPGRSIVGTAGITLYECGFVKKTYGEKNYLFINGGMTDNIRPALYQAKYAVDIVNKAENEKNLMVDIAGKCCESGDLIATDTMIPQAEPGDILAVYTTGAYTYSMSSNYNSITKPAVIFVGKDVKIVSKREKLEDLTRLF